MGARGVLGLLLRGAFVIAITTKHAAVIALWCQRCFASFAGVANLTDLCGQRFHLFVPALGTSDFGGCSEAHLYTVSLLFHIASKRAALKAQRRNHEQHHENRIPGIHEGKIPH